MDAVLRRLGLKKGEPKESEARKLVQKDLFSFRVVSVKYLLAKNVEYAGQSLDVAHFIKKLREELLGVVTRRCRDTVNCDSVYECVFLCVLM